MGWTRRGVLRGGAVGIAGGAIGSAAPWPLSPFGSGRARAEIPAGGVRKHATSLMGDPKYGADYAHFDYVNPSAPRGGSVRQDTTSRFDNFNPFVPAGNPGAGVGLVWETLQKRSLDEDSAQYGLLAEWMEEPEDHSWVALKIRDDARWHDGVAVTAADVIWTYERLIADGRPFYRFYYQNVAEALDVGDNTVLFRFSEAGNKELPHIIGDLSVLPAHWWADRDFAAPLLDPPLGSGPYRIAEFEFGRFVRYARVDDYWGRDVAPNIGQYNFDEIVYETFLDREISFEAFKSGSIDFWNENSSLRWASGYDFDAVVEGRVVKEEVVLGGPTPVQTYAFNLRRAKFQDIRVRQAFAMVFDFNFTNRAIFYNQYAQPISFFQGTPDLMATGLPDEAERALLEPFRDQVPAAVFDAPFAHPETDGSGQDGRRILRRARALLEEAGWVAGDDGVLRNGDGEAFELEFLLASAAQERVLRAFIDNLERLGVVASMRTIEVTQYVTRRDNYEYDMIIAGVSNSASPGNEQRDFWGSDVVDQVRGRNFAGVADPVVDALIEQIVFAENREALAAATRALDRVLLHNHYMVLQLYTPFERIAYWDRFSHPETRPSRSIGFPTVWWFNADGSAAGEDAQ